ncbi:MAG TPA: S1 family peptidase [Mycobacterium sp.]|nr:S1 family peptidase [Mycobacterium sp.]
MVVLGAVGLAAPATAAPPPAPGIEVDDDNGSCTAGFAAQGDDGSYYVLTSGHCDAGDGSEWTYGQDNALGQISASVDDGDQMDAAIIRLDPGTPAPAGGVGGYQIRDVLGPGQLAKGMPFCKIGAVTGETCGTINDIDGNVVEAGVFSLEGDSGSPGFVKNPDGTVSAVGILTSSPENDDYTTYFIMVQPVLAQWGLRILP